VKKLSLHNPKVHHHACILTSAQLINRGKYVFSSYAAYGTSSSKMQATLIQISSSIPQIQCANSCGTFAIKRCKNKSVEPDSISGEILKLAGEAMIPYLVPLFNITINNATIPSD
jgi:hypothetical protein